MNKSTKALILIFISSIFLSSCVKCVTTSENKSIAKKEDIYIEHVADEAILEIDIPAIRSAENISFLTEEQKEEWREPLIDFFMFLEENSQLMILKGVGLTDLNFDAIPEVVIFENDGGSAGSSSMTVYNLMTKEEIGSIRTGWWDGMFGELKLDEEGNSYGVWEVFQNVNDSSYEIFGRYKWSYGFDRNEQFLSKIYYDSETKKYFSSYLYMFFKDCDNIIKKVDDRRINVFIQNGYYVYRDYRTQATVGELEEYLAYVGQNYRLVGETQMKCFMWEDIGYGKESFELVAAKMADTLISSEQKFINPFVESTR